jgi:MFS family permease
MQRIAIGWLVYRLSNSALLLGLVGFAGQIPTFLLAPFAGALADRWNRQRMLVIIQTLAMIQALILAFLVYRETVVIWQIVLLSIFLGCVNAFDMPTRQSFVVEMVEKREDLGNAIALNSSLVNGARLLGPSIAGILIAAVGEGMCFLLNGLSYIAVIIALLSMRIAPKEAVIHKTHILQEVKEGFTYVLGAAPIRSILLLFALVSFMGMPFQVLMPLFAGQVFHGGPDTLGFLMGATGLGALIGTFYLASRKNALGLGKITVSAAGIFGTGLVIFSLSRLLWLSLLFMALTGFGMMVQMASSNTILQTIADDDKRGRVMSFYTVAFMRMAPFGNLLAGDLADKIGAPDTILFSGICCVLGALIFVRKLPSVTEEVRPDVPKKGFINLG